MFGRLALTLTVLLCAFLGGLSGHMLLQQSAQAQDAPASQKVGLVNLRKLFLGYAKTRAKENEIKAKYRKMEKDLKIRVQQLEEAKARLSNWKKDDPIYRKKLSKLAEQFDTVKGRLAWSQKGLQIEMRRTTEAIFREIFTEVATYGKAHNYELILKINNDDIASTSDNELQAKLSREQVLYSHETIDLTGKILEQLNKRYR